MAEGCHNRRKESVMFDRSTNTTGADATSGTLDEKSADHPVAENYEEVVALLQAQAAADYFLKLLAQTA
jgi:hypothetical protein